MKNAILFFIVIFTLQVSWPLHAEPESLPVNATTEDIRGLLADFHAVLEGEEDSERGLAEALRHLLSKSGRREWIEKFNFKKVGLNAYRLYHIKSEDARIRQHVANLAFIFPASHLLETLSGPVMSSVSAALGWPAELTAGLGTVGAVISVPGLDPLCILIYSTYPLPRVRNTVTFVREKTMSALGFAGTVTGVNSLLRRVADGFLWKSVSRGQFEADDGGINVFRGETPEPLVRITWNADRTHMEGAQFSDEALRLDGKALEKQLEFLPYNVRVAVMEARDVFLKASRPFYVDFAEVSVEGIATVHWRARSVPISSRFAGCAAILSTPRRPL